jgi:hypothetical protein
MSEIRKLGANDLELATGNTGSIETTTSPGLKVVTKLDAAHINLRSVSGSIESNITSLDTRVDTLETTSATHTTDIDAAEARLDTAEAELNAITYGTYLPTGTVGSYTSSVTPLTAMYTRNGTIVHVHGYCYYVPSSTSVYPTFYLSLPISTSFTAAQQYTGLVGYGTSTATISDVTYQDPAIISAYTTSNIALIKCYSRQLSWLHLLSYSFAYQIL